MLADVQKWAETHLPTRSPLAIKMRLGSLFFGYNIKMGSRLFGAREKLKEKESEIEEFRKENMRLKKAEKTKKTTTEIEKEEGELTDEGDESM